MSTLTWLRKAANALLHPMGFEVRRTAQTYERMNLGDALHDACSLGFSPKTVIDVGVAEGTDPLYSVFPNAHHVLIEPLHEYEDHLQSHANSLGSAETHLAVASSEPGIATINVHPDLYGSSLYREDKEDSSVDGRLSPYSCAKDRARSKMRKGPALR